MGFWNSDCSDLGRWRNGLCDRKGLRLLKETEHMACNELDLLFCAGLIRMNTTVMSPHCSRIYKGKEIISRIRELEKSGAALHC